MTSDPTAKPNLGRLEKIDLAVYWKTEATDFIPWLIQDENLKLLAECIGMELQVVLNAAQVEDLQSDLLCRDRTTGGWVLIGNQLNPSNEKHLGRLLTYAADIEAAAVVWIASQFSADHRTTLDWLNRITQPTIQFFGLELELWRIGEGAMAPRFNRITQIKPIPLETHSSESVEESVPDPEPPIVIIEAKPEPLSETQQQNLDFWTTLCNQLEQRGSIVKAGSPVSEERIYFAIGRAGFRLFANLDREATCLDIGLSYGGVDTHAFFSLLLAQNDDIETEIGIPIGWSNDSDGQNFEVYATLAEIDLDTSHWPTYMDWMCNGLERLHNTFSERIKSLRVDDFKPLPNYSLNTIQNVLILPN